MGVRSGESTLDFPLAGRRLDVLSRSRPARRSAALSTRPRYFGEVFESCFAILDASGESALITLMAAHFR
jgi:hypothetical protein